MWYLCRCSCGTVKAIRRDHVDAGRVILNDFVKDGFLVRDGEGYQIAPGVKVTETQLEAR